MQQEKARLNLDIWLFERKGKIRVREKGEIRIHGHQSRVCEEGEIALCSWLEIGDWRLCFKIVLRDYDPLERQTG